MPGFVLFKKTAKKERQAYENQIAGKVMLLILKSSFSF